MPARNVDLTIPSDYSGELAAIARRRKLAEMLQAQAYEPMPPTQSVAGWAIPYSPMQGLAKVAQSASAEYQQRQTDERTRKLAERVRQDTATSLEQFQRTMGGQQAPYSKEGAAAVNEARAAFGMEPAAPVPEIPLAQRRSEALAGLLRSPNPALRDAALTQLMKQPEWKLGERFNAQTGRKEKFMYNALDPSQIMLAGGQEAVRLNMQNLGGSMQGFHPFTGQAVGPGTPTTLTPQQQWQQQTQFPWQQQVERARLGQGAQGLAQSGARLWYETGLEPMGGGATPPLPPSAAPAGAGAGAAQPPSVPSPARVPIAPPQLRPAPGALPPGVTPKQESERIAKLRKELPEAQNALAENRAVFQSMRETLDTLLNATGAPAQPNEPLQGRIKRANFGMTTGPAGLLTGLIPGTGAANQAVNIQELSDKIGLMRLSVMRAASATGASGLGALSEKELGVLQSSVAALSRMQSPEAMRNTLLRIANYLDSTERRLESQFGSQFREGMELSIPPSGGTPTDVDALVKKYDG